MPVRKLKKKVSLTAEDAFEQFKSSWKKRFEPVIQIASSVDWNFKYAFYKPVPPTEQEIEHFKKEVDALKRELQSLKRRLKPTNPIRLEILENKLNHMVDDYINYPFSDRELFFRARLKFLRKAVRSCFVRR